MSGPIRRKIATAKRHIRRALDEYTNIAVPANLQALTDDALIDIFTDVDESHAKIVHSYSTLEHLLTEWDHLQQTSPNEQQEFDNYIAKYGDFRIEMNTAATTLTLIDSITDTLINEMKTRNIDPDIYEGSEDSGSNKGDDFTQVSPVLPQLPQVPTAPTQSPPTAINSHVLTPLPTRQPTQRPVAETTTRDSRPQLQTTRSNFVQQQWNTTPFYQPVNSFDSSLLSRLDLPDFNGSILKFPEFWARFTTLIDSKDHLDGATKFSLLKSCLRGPALQCVEGLPITDHDYRIAVDILKSTYDDKATIRHVLFTRLANLPACDQEGRKLHNLFLEMNKLVRQYHYMDPTTADSEYGLGSILLTKLPRSVRSRIYDRNVQKKNLSPMDLLNLLADIVHKDQVLQEMETPHINCRPTETFHVQQHRRNDQRQGHHQNQRQGQQAAMVTQRPQRQPFSRSERNPCPFCNDSNHGARQCSTVTSVSSRLDIVKRKKLCFNCLKEGHSSSSCQGGSCRSCGGRHHTAICTGSPTRHQSNQQHYQPRPPRQQGYHHVQPRSQQQFHQGNQQAQQFNRQQQRMNAPVNTHFVNQEDMTSNETPILEEPVYTATEAVHQADNRPALLQQVNNVNDHGGEAPSVDNEQVLLMCTDVEIFHPNEPSKKTTVTAFLDSGSSRSYISREAAQALGLDSMEEENLVLHTFGQTKPMVTLSQLHVVGIRLNSTEEQQMTLRVKSLPVLTNQLSVVSITDEDLPAIMKEEMMPGRTKKKKPSLLIGSDYFWEILLSPQFHVDQLPNGYRVLHTKIGPIVTGKNFNYQQIHSVLEDDANPLGTKALETLLAKFWNLESAGICDSATAKDDDICLDYFNKTITFSPEEKRYLVKWPFRMPTNDLPSNFELCMARLRRNWNQLSTNPVHLSKYSEIIQDQLTKGIIEEIPIDRYAPQGSHHFISHHAVVTENKKTTKVRIVYDASGKTKEGKCLNEHLFRGPVLLPDLAGVLLRIRTVPILLSADIEKAFLMVGLHEEDRNYTKFLWLRDPTLPPTLSNVVAYRFARVCFGVVSSPFLLAATIHYHLMNATTPIAKDILLNLYVDNTFLSANSIEEAKMKYDVSKKLFNDASMNLREWCSNNSELNKYFEEKESLPVDEIVSVLGLSWNTKDDSISVKISQPHENTAWTKRHVLKQVASSFDPLGLLSPMTLLGKLFLQSLWKHELSWDTPLSPEILLPWLDICSAWKMMEKLTVPRKLFDRNKDNDYTLHVFCDASKDAYAATAYIRVEDISTKEVNIQLLMSKTRLSPIKSKITIPRLELAGITIASTLVKYLFKELNLPISKSFIWSDSKVALQWCKSSKNLPVFITNRVKTIDTNAPSTTLRHVRSEDNPADLASRGVLLQELLNSQLWWNGPRFLKFNEEQWPQDLSEKSTTEEAFDESEETANFVADSANSKMIDGSRYRSWERLINTVMLILIFISKKCNRPNFVQSRRSQLYNRSRLIVFRQAQAERPPPDHLIRSLNLFMCPKTNVWRSKGRISNSDLPFDTQFPIYLPRDSPITKLYILFSHRNLNHCGTSQVLSEMRQEVWIPKGRQAIETTIRNQCYDCRRKKAKPFILPPFPDHPTERVTRPSAPFENIGLDYIGPFTQLKGDVHKVWICLITCLNSRAIYTDIAVDLSTTSFLHIMRRFVATYGSPSWIVSDNAPTFKCFADLQNSLETHLLQSEDQDLVDYCTYKKITFKFITPFSPWSGGVYERMVGLFKTSLQGALHRTRVSLEELRTLCKESEACVNCRPLTYVSSDINDIPLRPIDFIRPNTNISSPRFDHDEEEWRPTSWKPLLQQWKESSRIIDKFWSQWQTSYIPSLREKPTYNHPHGRAITSRQPKVGELVILHDDHLPRGQWRIGRIIELPEGPTKFATLRMPNRRLISRPISHLLPLEISSDLVSTDDQEEQLEQIDQPPRHPMITRSKARLNPHLLMTFAILASCIIATSASPPMFTVPNTQCPASWTTPKTIIYSDRCRADGIAVALYSEGSQSSICWFKINCPLGHIHIDIPPKPNTGYCGDLCKCPRWTKTCSHYNGLLCSESTVNNLPPDFNQYRPVGVCSFSPTDACSPMRRIGTFPQIELFDNSTIVVPQLHITTRDFGKTEDVTCFSTLTGKLSKLGSTNTGPPNFCRHHRCTTTATTFCLYSEPVSFYKYNNSEIAIRAWGSIPREYYSYPEPKESTGKSISSCTKGGIKIKDIGAEIVEICISTTCVFLRSPTTTEPILFPTQLVIYDHKIEVSVWKGSVLIHQDTLKCTGHPICEMIECRICYMKMMNSQCWSDVDYMVIVFFIFGLVLSMYAFMCQAVIFILCLPLICLRRLISWIIGKRRPSSLSSVTRYSARQRRRRQRAHTTGMLMVICMMFHHTFACSEISSFSGTTRTCVSNGQEDTCTFSESTIITLQPIGQEVCLAFRNTNDTVVGALSLRINGIRHVCNKRTLYHTHNHVFSVESSHRCSSAGSCKDGACGKVQHTTKIEELSYSANESPGFSYCSNSCGCVTCDGCFYCDPSCLFYRVFATSTSPTVYEIFKCPTWNLELSLTASLTLNQTISTVLTLLPGRTSSWNNIKFTMSSATNPTMPLLSSTFITDGQRTGIVEDSPPEQLRANSVGQLQCSTRKDAEDFNCRFSPASCSCSTSAYSASCNCPSGDMNAYLSESTLPANGKGIRIKSVNSTLEATLTSGSATQVQISTQGLQITTRSETNQCHIKVSALEGCYACTHGASFEAVCTTTIGEEAAEIDCNGQKLITLCTPEEEVRLMKIHLTTSAIFMNCSLTCPGSTSYFVLEGSLDFVPEVPVAEFENALQINRAAMPTDNDTLHFFAHPISFINNLISDFLSFTSILKLLLLVSGLTFLYILYRQNHPSPPEFLRRKYR